MTDIKPALTEEQWRIYMAGYARLDVEASFGLGHMPDLDTKDPHAIAALALHGQEFGFSWDDVDTLRKYDVIVARYEGRQDDEVDMHALADRIASLLPPRESGQ